MEEQEQSKEWSTMLAKGLVLYMWKKKLREQDLAAELGLGRNTISKLLKGDYDMQMPIKTMWRLLDMSDVCIVPNEQIKTVRKFLSMFKVSKVRNEQEDA